MNIPSGIIGDTRGRKPLMVWGPAITALGAPSFYKSFVDSQPTSLEARITLVKDILVAEGFGPLESKRLKPSSYLISLRGISSQAKSKCENLCSQLSASRV